MTFLRKSIWHKSFKFYVYTYFYIQLVIESGISKPEWMTRIKYMTSTYTENLIIL